MGRYLCAGGLIVLCWEEMLISFAVLVVLLVIDESFFGGAK